VTRRFKLLATILAIAVLAGILPTMFVGATQARVEGTATAEIIDTRDAVSQPTSYRNPWDGTNKNMTVTCDNFLEDPKMTTADSMFGAMILDPENLSPDGSLTSIPQWLLDAWAQGNYYIAAMNLTTQYDAELPTPSGDSGPNYNAVWKVTLNGLPAGVDLSTANWAAYMSNTNSGTFYTHGDFWAKESSDTGVVFPASGGVAASGNELCISHNPGAANWRNASRMYFFIVELDVVEPSESPSAEVSPAASASAEATATTGPEPTASPAVPSPKSGDASVVILFVLMGVAAAGAALVLRKRSRV